MNNTFILHFAFVASSVIFLSLHDVVSGGLASCRFRYGPIPLRIRCDTSITSTNRGSTQFLDNQPTDNLITNTNLETPEMTLNRLNGDTTSASTPSKAFVIDLINEVFPYDPKFDAYCFNEEYPVPNLSLSEQINLYLEYKTEFDKLLRETMNDVTNQRIPGMFLRMCFHDNAVNENEKDFRSYVDSSIDPITNQWIGDTQNMPTSGADASNLICFQERRHPNNVIYGTAPSVLLSIQKVKNKYMYMSYADLLHNGCNAAAIYLTGKDPATALTANPFTFGRKDACHADQTCSKKYPLCGPTELLPGVNFNLANVTNWFTSRGMSECLFMGLMWTHTTMQAMDFLCPVQRLTCTASATDVANFGNNNRYFDAGDNLDYFDFFLNRGAHKPGGDDGNGDGSSRGLCDWTVDGNNVNWPMSQIDCTLAISNVEAVGTTPKIAQVVRNFVHNATAYSRYDILQCALNVLGGHGTAGVEGNAACKTVIPTDCNTIVTNKFGAYYSTVPSSANVVTRTTVDPSCGLYGYRRDRRRTMMMTIDKSSPDSVIDTYKECLNEQFDLYLVTEGAHLAMLVKPTTTVHCPSIVMHSSYDNDKENPTMEKLMIVLSPEDVEQFEVNDDESDSRTGYHLGVRSLLSVVQAYETAPVGLNGLSTEYNPITNNCAAFLRNMAYPLNIPITNNVTQYIINRLSQTSNNDPSTEHMFQLIQDSPLFRTVLYNNSGDNEVYVRDDNIGSIFKEDIIRKIMNLYI